MSEDLRVEPPWWVRVFDLEMWVQPGEGEHAAVRRWMQAGLRWTYEHDPDSPISQLIDQAREDQ
jgi:hypothetical protein